MPSVFISYSSDDVGFVKRLEAELRSHGVSLWLDRKQIKVGQRIPRRIKEGIFECDYFLIVISKSSLQSNWVRDELDSAYFESIKDRIDTVLPVVVNDVEIPKELQHIRFADFRTSFKQGLEDLLQVFELDEDYIRMLGTAKRKELIRKLLRTTDGWGEMPSEIVALVEDESYLEVFEKNLQPDRDRTIVSNSVDAIRYLADYDYDNSVIRDHSSISPLISLYERTTRALLKEKIIGALAEIGSRLCHEFFKDILEEEGPKLKAAILTGLWDMSVSGDYADWDAWLMRILHKYSSQSYEKCLYFDFEKEESDFRFWVFRCLAEAKKASSVKYIDRFFASNTRPLATLAEAAAAHWHTTGDKKYTPILRQAIRAGASCSAQVTLDRIKEADAKPERSI